MNLYNRIVAGCCLCVFIYGNCDSGPAQINFEHSSNLWEINFTERRTFENWLPSKNEKGINVY